MKDNSLSRRTPDSLLLVTTLMEIEFVILEDQKIVFFLFDINRDVKPVKPVSTQTGSNRFKNRQNRFFVYIGSSQRIKH